MDWKEKSYNYYHTHFKELISDNDPESIKSLYRHFDYKLLTQLNKFKSDSQILDLGCGPGYLIEYLINKGYTNTLGVDISEQQINICKSKNLNVQLFDVFGFFAQNKTKYDIIIALDFIEHFSKKELFDLFELIFNSLNADGVLIVRTPNGQGFMSGNIIYGDLTHETIFTPNSLLQLLKVTGFKIISFREDGPVPKNLQGVLRTFIWEVSKFLLSISKIAQSGKGLDILSHNFYAFARK